jgi:hypothetical protein
LDLSINVRLTDFNDREVPGAKTELPSNLARDFFSTQCIASGDDNERTLNDTSSVCSE